MDARKLSPGSFHDTGFTLIQLEEEPDVTDWRTNGFLDPNADVKKFHKQMEPHLMKLYPDTKRQTIAERRSKSAALRAALSKVGARARAALFKKDRSASASGALKKGRALRAPLIFLFALSKF